MRKLLREPRQPSDPVPSAVRAALEQIPADLVRELSAQPERVVSMGAMTLSTKSTSLNVELAEDGSGRIVVARNGRGVIDVGWEPEKKEVATESESSKDTPVDP